MGRATRITCEHGGVLLPLSWPSSWCDLQPTSSGAKGPLLLVPDYGPPVAPRLLTPDRNATAGLRAGGY